LEKKTLEQGASARGKVAHLVFTFRAFGQHLQIQAPRQLDERTANGLALRQTMHVADKRAVDLELVERQFAQVAHAGKTGAEVVDGDAHAHVVVRLPAALAQRLDACTTETFEWRGLTLPVVDPRRALPALSGDAPRQLAVVQQSGHPAAVAIGGVKAMIAAGTAQRFVLSPGTAREIDMVSVDSHGHRASYAVLDLNRLAAAA
jgi:hypothetical protein